MARTGRFGRQPRSAPSLTNTLVAIAREFQNQRAQNIMDAWQKGGMFEGKKATDEVVLAFWKGKVEGVSKDDPLYDTYKNASTQLEYSVAESKMTAKYALKGATDGQMVAFYLNWAKKVPKNSEFYRVLQRDAGQYMRNNRASGEAEARRRAELRYQSQQEGTRQAKEAGGEYIIDTMRRLAQSGFAEGGIAPTIAAPGSGSDFTDFDPADPATMLRLIAAVTSQTGGVHDDGRDTSVFKGNDSVLYHDDDKKPVTGTDILNQLGKLTGGTFTPGVPFTVDYVTGLLDTQMAGLNERIARAKQSGHMTDVVSLEKSKGYVAMLNREFAAMPVQKAYMEARGTYDSVVGDSTASPAAVLKAWDAFSSTLTSLSEDPRVAADDNFRSRIIAERDGTPGIPTLTESFTGLADGAFDPSSAQDAAKNAAGIERMQEQVDVVAGGGAFWTYGTTNKDGIFVPKAGGREVGAATPESIKAGGENMQELTIADPRGGLPIKMYVTAVPVYATAKNPVTGEALNSDGARTPIAYAYDLPKGEGSTTQYGFMTKEGYKLSADPPWDETLPTVNSSKDGNHIEVDLSARVAQLLGPQDAFTGKYAGNIDLSKNVDLGGGFKVQGAGTNSRGATPGEVTFDPQTAAWSTDTRAGIGSPDPTTDFSSLTLSTLMADEEGRHILMNIDRNPEFKQQIGNDNLGASGATWDPVGGGYVPGTADQAKLSQLQGQASLASNAKSFSEFVVESAKTWQRVTTGSPMKGSTSDTPAGQPDFGGGVMKLATDLIQNTPFAALGDAFTNGTNNRKPVAQFDEVMKVKTVSTMKLPTVDPKVITSLVQGATPGGTTQQSSTAPTTPTQQQGSQAPGGPGNPYYTGPR